MHVPILPILYARRIIFVLNQRFEKSYKKNLFTRPPTMDGKNKLIDLPFIVLERYK